MKIPEKKNVPEKRVRKERKNEPKHDRKRSTTGVVGSTALALWRPFQTHSTVHTHTFLICEKSTLHGCTCALQSGVAFECAVAHPRSLTPANYLLLTQLSKYKNQCFLLPLSFNNATNTLNGSCSFFILIKMTS